LYILLRYNALIAGLKPDKHACFSSSCFASSTSESHDFVIARAAVVDRGTLESGLFELSQREQRS
jgi:hypothetical protein